MFIGHYGVGLVLKKKAPQLPLWLLFLAVQFVDILAFVLVILGIEQIHYQPNANPFLRTNIEYLPFSHSLFTNVLWAGLVFLIFAKWKNKTWGTILGVGVISHWFLDLLVHTPDLPLFFNQLKVGLGLWYFPRISFLIEIVMVIGGAVFLYRKAPWSFRSFLLIGLILFSYYQMNFTPEPEFI
ncbi:MAG: hypothetical protein C0407_13855, partial [Desulfobacca sp.]|nr:hypothetical protein [Desulfobacca sp.]